jgi:hypothetical protein
MVEKFIWFWIPFCLGFDIQLFAMKPKRLLQTSATVYPFTQCQVRVESNPQAHRRVSLKTLTLSFYIIVIIIITGTSGDEVG